MVNREPHAGHLGVIIKTILPREMCKGIAAPQPLMFLDFYYHIDKSLSCP